MPTKNESAWIYSSYASLPGLHFLVNRSSYHRHCGPRKIARVKAMLAKSRAEGRAPQIVVCYGSHRKKWEAIAGASIDKTMSSGAQYKLSEGTLFLVTPHPRKRGRTNQYWLETGLELHRLINHV